MAAMPSVVNAMVDNLAGQTQRTAKKKKPMSEAMDIAMDKADGKGSFKPGSAAHTKEDRLEKNKRR